MPVPSPKCVTYSNVREDIDDGDLLLFRTRSTVAYAGRSRYSHVGLAGWWGNRLMCVESREGHGARAVTLSSQVKRFPGQIDVYQVSDQMPRYFSRQTALAAMVGLTGRDYGWWTILRILLCRLPLVWRMFPASSDDGSPLPNRVIRSQAVAYACRTAGVDPVPGLSDAYTEPGDLARSPYWRYAGTLYPEMVA